MEPCLTSWQIQLGWPQGQTLLALLATCLYHLVSSPVVPLWLLCSAGASHRFLECVKEESWRLVCPDGATGAQGGRPVGKLELCPSLSGDASFPADTLHRENI